MLINKLFTIKDLDSTDTEIRATILINVDHEVFVGHFPGQPVLPGVCMIQIVKEILELITGKVLVLQIAQDIKFLAVVDPRKQEVVDISINYTKREGDTISVTAAITSGELTHFKFKGEFSSILQ